MLFQPADTLRSRTFVGLLVAQFLAAFNDQAIHASAMFFAIHRKTLTQDNAISLMPILFYAPWAIFCTVAGYTADRFSKRQSLVFWKIAEIGIMLVALSGFYLGSVQGAKIGPWLVLSTVFLMGMHSAFFVPAKYGAMPEILQPHLLSRGNGLLESLSFLAVITGTVCGGIFSFWFKDREWAIGLVLVSLAVVGAGASFLIERMPAANPDRRFPRNLFKPLWQNLNVMLRSRQLALAVLAIAFFTFVVAFMRGTMYMHGETRNPHWSELHTSVVVGVVALGIGLGSPLAGLLSGGKVELGLVPLGGVGMMLSLAIVSITLDSQVWLIGCLVALGFFTGFYIVPMYTLLQHRAPKASKGDLLASSNFINVVGAITASVLFKMLVLVASWTGITQTVMPEEVAHGILKNIDLEDGHMSLIDVVDKENQPVFKRDRAPGQQLEQDGTLLESDDVGVGKGTPVIVSQYSLPRQGDMVTYYKVQPADMPLTAVSNNEPLTRYLFLMAGVLTLCSVVALRKLLPDFFLRSLIWLRSLGHYQINVIGMGNLPDVGPAVLLTNCPRFEEAMRVLASTDRYARFFVWRRSQSTMKPWLTWRMARNCGLVVVEDVKNEGTRQDVVNRAAKSLERGDLIALPVAEAPESATDVEGIIEKLRQQRELVLLPVYCSKPNPLASAKERRHVQVVIGRAMPARAAFPEIRGAVEVLGDWLRQIRQDNAHIVTSMIPGPNGTSQKSPTSLQ
ncbi:MAG TPA: MFS transporter [Gemmataceae bacterium]|nr:MFS transporter [Gemmataceae bacterium]